MRSVIRLLIALAVCTSASPAEPPDQQAVEMQKAVDEFKILTRNLGIRADSPPRKGRQSGKMQWHGRLFENLRNDLLDSVPHEIAQRGETKSLLRRNQFGFNVGGPVYIPRLYSGGQNTYFSASYEGVRERVSRSTLQTIPTLAERAGDWSATVDQAGNPLRIFDPATTRPNPDFDPSLPVTLDNLQYLRDPFPGSRIPADRIDTVARNALEFYPAPNTDVGPFFRNNYFLISPETNTANGMIAKVDHALRERHRFTLGLSFSNGALGAARYMPSIANPGPADRQFHSRRASLDHVFTKSPQTVNTISFEATTDASRSGVEDENAAYAARVGLRGAGGDGFPVFRISPYLSMGRAYPVSRNARNAYTWTDALSARHGKYGLRVVGRYAHYQVNSFWAAYPASNFRFGDGLTSLPGIINTGHAFASFLLGLPEFGERSVVASPSYFQRSYYQLAVSNQYEVRKGLNVSLGVNFTCNTPRVEKYDRMSTVSLAAINPVNGRPGAMVVAARNGQGRSFQPALFKAGPSAGLTWNPRGNAKTVVRLSVARDYGAIPIYFGQWGTQAFNASPTYISPNVQLEPALVLSGGVPPLDHALPDLRPEAANDTVAELMDASGRQPTYQSASLSVERELPASVVVTLGAAYSGGKNLLVGSWAANPNAVPLDALVFRDRLNDEDFNRSLRPYPQYKGFDLYDLYPLGRYQRDAGFVRLEKRATAGLSLNLYYEFSKQMDDYSGPRGKQDFFNRQNEWSLTAYNHPQYLSLSYVYELPFGASKALLAFSDWRRYLVDGWSFTGQTSLVSGEPLALQPAFNNTGGIVPALNVNVVPGVDPHAANPGPEMWFNPGAFDQPADFTIGNASRTNPTLRAPLSQNHDLAVNKRFGLAADRSIEISAMGLNFLNHANWNQPDTVIGPASAPNVNAGRIIGSRGGRVVQLGMRFSF